MKRQTLLLLCLFSTALLAANDEVPVYPEGRRAFTVPKQVPHCPSGALAWDNTDKVFSCASGGSWWSPASPPSSPHTWDVEFDSSTLTDGWSIDTANSTGEPDLYATLTTASAFTHSLNSWRPGWLMIQPNNTGTSLRVASISSLTVPTNLLVYARMSVMPKRGTVSGSVTNNQSSIGLEILGSATDRISLWIVETDTNTWEAQFDENEGGVFTSVATSQRAQGVINTNDTPHFFEYVAIQKRGTTYHAWLGSNAGMWFWMASTTHAGTMSGFGISAADSTTTPPGSALLGVDFVRFVETSNWLP